MTAKFKSLTCKCFRFNGGFIRTGTKQGTSQDVTLVTANADGYQMKMKKCCLTQL